MCEMWLVWFQAKQEALKQKEGSGTFTKVRRQKKQKVKHEGPLDPALLASQAAVAAEGADKPKVKGLPSHWGPKVRHKPRGPPKASNKPKDKKSRAQVRQEKGGLKRAVQEEAPVTYEQVTHIMVHLLVTHSFHMPSASSSSFMIKIVIKNYIMTRNRSHDSVDKYYY